LTGISKINNNGEQFFEEAEEEVSTKHRTYVYTLINAVAHIPYQQQVKLAPFGNASPMATFAERAQKSAREMTLWYSR
jgi:hypothetical protein